MARAQKSTDAIGQCKLQVGHLNGGVSRASELPHRLNDLGDSASIGGMVVAQSTAVGVDGERALPSNQLAIGHQTPTLTFRTKPQVFELHQRGDGETVINGCVANIGGLDSRPNRGEPPPLHHHHR